MGREVVNKREAQRARKAIREIPVVKKCAYCGGQVEVPPVDVNEKAVYFCNLEHGAAWKGHREVMRGLEAIAAGVQEVLDSVGAKQEPIAAPAEEGDPGGES